MDRVIIITGAGGGLGRALAHAALAAGDTVVAIGRDAAALAESGAGAGSGRYLPRVADVADFTALEALIASAIADLGRVDGLFANAAIYPRGLMVDQPVEVLMRVLAVNVGGVAAACRAVLPTMMRQARGRIITVGSYADRAPLPDSGAYSASKGALHALTKAIAAEVGTDYPDILVNEWVPGSLATRMGIVGGMPPEVAARRGVELLDLPPGGPSGEIMWHEGMELPPLSLKRKLLGKLGLGWLKP